MVWSESSDTITIPQDAAPGQDTIILTGVDVPPELVTLGVTTCILYLRSDYPSLGAIPEVEYFWDGLFHSVFTHHVRAQGVVINDKAGTKTGVITESTGIGEGAITQNTRFFVNKETYAAKHARVIGATAGANLPVQKMTLANGWSDAAVSYRDNGLYYYPLPNGMINVTGVVIAPSSGPITDLSMANLPVSINVLDHLGATSAIDIRPKLRQQWFNVITSSGPGILIIRDDGAIYVTGGTGFATAVSSTWFIDCTYRVYGEVSSNG